MHLINSMGMDILLKNQIKIWTGKFEYIVSTKFVTINSYR